MSAAINIAKQLKTPAVNKIKNKLLKNFDLTEKHLMSTSGRNYVSLCKDKKNNKYILKIRRENTKKNKKNFTKEALVYDFFKNKKNNFLVFPDIIKIDSVKDKQYLLYRYLDGEDSGIYFFLSKNAKKNLNPETVLKSLDFIQKQTKNIKKKIKLDKLENDFYIKFYKKYKKSFLKNLNNDLYERGLKIIKKNLTILMKKFVFVHNDFNPKNVILLKKKDKKFIKNKIALIDWSDAALGNSAWDAGFIYLASWNNSKFNKKIRNYHNEKKQIFNLNCLILIPKLFNIVNNYKEAINYEYKSGKFDKKTKERHIDNANKASASYQKKYKELIKYFS